MNASPIVAISTQDHKLASLLFDYIVPVHTRESVPHDINFEYASSIKIPESTTDEVHDLFRNFTKQYEAMQNDGKLNELINQIKDDELTSELISEGVNEQHATLATFVTHGVRNTFAKNAYRILHARNIRSVPIFHSIPSYQNFFPGGLSDAVEINLLNAKVIDTTNLEWRHVAEIRRDKNFSKQLRNFRLFLNENYQGKDMGYISDHLQQKLEKYEESCKKHGVQLTLSAISQTLDSKSLLGSIAIATACILTGNPTIASLGIISGTSVEIGKMVVNIMQKKLEYDEKIENAELSYLFKLERKIKK